MMSEKASRVVDQEKSFSGCTKYLLHLLEEHWFFYNALGERRILTSPGGLIGGDLATNKLSVRSEPVAKAVVKTEKSASPLVRQLVRTPSLPPPPVSREGSTGLEEESVSGGRKLSYFYSSLDGPRQFILCSSTTSTATERPPRTGISHRRCANPHLVMCWQASYMKAFHKKKWRSLGDLETMELQGFKDLGFVIDDMKGSSSRLVRVIPALGEGKEREDDGKIYLPEGWFTQRSAPLMILRQVSCISAEEMKEQLRFWARAVACNVWQKC